MKLGLSRFSVPIGVICMSVFCPQGVRAWDIHQTLMPFILEAASPQLKTELKKSFQIPCPAEDLQVLQQLVKDLTLNTATRVPPTTTGKCGSGNQMSADEILMGSSVDDPDQGMDRDLPPSADPDNIRKWMGGIQGPSSQGFRHMYFGGWKISHPVATFQIPTYAIGQGPLRADIMGKKAREYYHSGVGAWSIRLLGWALHYVQDMTQPFHAVEAVTLRIIPWAELFAWPPGTAVSTFIQETTRTVSNYHWAYEGYTRFRLKEGKTSPFADCLQHPRLYSQLNLDDLKNAQEVALKVAQASIEIAPELGAAELEFFGKDLLGKNYNLPANIGIIDNDNYSKRADLKEQRERLHNVTCKALANASLSSLKVMEQVLLP